MSNSIRNCLRFQRSRLGWQARGAESASVAVALIAVLALVIELRYPAWFSLPPEAPAQLQEDSPDISAVDKRTAAFAENERDQAISTFLAKRYRVSHEVALEFVRIAYSAGQAAGVDPLLIIAVMAIESRLNPIAESEAGAKGLMQIIPRFHPEKLVEFGGEKAIFEPRTNIVVGSQILREYIQRAGDVASGLKVYSGWPLDGESSYPGRVLDEKRRLQSIVSQQRKVRNAPSRQVSL